MQILGYDILENAYPIDMIFEGSISYWICYTILYLYLICKMNKNNIKYILFSMFKIKITSHSDIFYLKKNEVFVMFNNIHD